MFKWINIIVLSALAITVWGFFNRHPTEFAVLASVVLTVVVVVFLLLLEWVRRAVRKIVERWSQ